MRSERERLLDILEAIERIEKYAARGKIAFENDELIQNWMVSHIALIGEACRALPDDFQAQYANVPWTDIIAMRNILVHHYPWFGHFCLGFQDMAFYGCFDECRPLVARQL